MRSVGTQEISLHSLILQLKEPTLRSVLEIPRAEDLVYPLSRLKDRRSECSTDAPSCPGSHLTLKFNYRHIQISVSS